MDPKKEKHELSRGIGWVFVLGFIVVGTWWLWHIPSVGKGGMVLAVAATLLPLFWEKSHVVAKMCWIGMIFIFLSVEYRAIDHEQVRAERDKEAALRAQEQGFETILSQNQADFDNTLKEMKGLGDLSKTAISTSTLALNQITGGGQYCYLMALPDGPGKVVTVVMNSGPYPLERCFVRITDNSPIKSAQDAIARFNGIVAKELGPVAPSKNLGMTTDIVLPFGSYYMQITTRNDRFFETLTVNSPPYKKGEGFETIEVRNDKGKLVYSQP